MNFEKPLDNIKDKDLKKETTEENDTGSELDPEKEKEARIFFHKIIEEYIEKAEEKSGKNLDNPYSGYEENDAWFYKSEQIRNELLEKFGYKSTGDETMWLGTENIFFEELIDIFKNTKSEHSVAAAYQISQELFPSSTNPASFIEASDLLKFGAKIINIPALRRDLEDKILGEASIIINSIHEDKIEDIVKEIEKNALYEKMDILEFLKYIMAYSSYNGWANNVPENIEKIINKIEEKEKSFLLKKFLEIFKLKIEKTYESLHKPDLENNIEGRVGFVDAQNCDKTGRIFIPNKKLDRENREEMMRIGEDLVALVDYKGEPIEFAKVLSKNFNKEPLKVHFKYIDEIEDDIRRYEENENKEKEWIFIKDRRYSLSTIIEKFIENIVIQEIDNIEEISKKLQEIYGKADFSWEGFLQDPQIINHLPQEKRKEIIEKTKGKLDILKKEKQQKGIYIDLVDFQSLTDKYNYKFTSEEIAEKDFLLFKHLHHSDMRWNIENEMGVDMIDIPFNYQVHFLKFLAEKDEKEVNHIKEFLDESNNYQDKINRIKTFLAIESGEEIGKQVFSVAEKTEPEISQKIFEKYASIIDTIEDSKETIASTLIEQNISDDEIRSINSNLIVKANRMIADFAQELDKNTKEDNIKEKLLRKLDRYQEDLMLTASVYKTLKKESGRDIRIEDIKDIQLQTKNATEIKDEELQQMLDIYGKNYDNRPEFKNQLLESFKNKIKENRQDTVLYVIKKGNQIIAFNRFDRNPDETKYFGSFNVDPNMQDSSIGTALFEESLRIESEDSKPIKATCDAFSTATIMYIEKGGFVVTDIIPEPGNETGEKIFQIEKSDVIESKYKEIPQKEIIRMQEDEEQKENSIILKLGKNPKEISNATEDLINNKKYLLTRYFCDKERTNVYCVLEKS